MKTRMRWLPGVAAFLACFVMAQHSAAEVLHADPAGFVVRHEVSLVAPKETAWRMLVGHVGEWWNGDHTYSGNAENLYIEERALGCFCERLGEVDAVVHLTVTALRRGSLLRLTGGLGPLGLMGVDGNLVFSFSESDGQTLMAMEYRVGGYDPDGLDKIAPAVDATLIEQVERYVRFVESGSAEIIIDDMLEDALPELE